jgi:cobalamin biosynthesis Co2+ chelatase CbiK
MSVLFVGHGAKEKETNAIYRVFLERLRRDGFSNCSLILLSEGVCGLESGMSELPKDEPVTIIPLTVARGNTVDREIYGDDAASVKSRLAANGFAVIPYEKTLLEAIVEKNLHFALWGDWL